MRQKLTLKALAVFLFFFFRLKIAIKDTILEKGNISFCDVVGLTHAKQALKEALIMPLQYPHLFTGEGITPLVISNEALTVK